MTDDVPSLEMALSAQAPGMALTVDGEHEIGAGGVNVPPGAHLRGRGRLSRPGGLGRFDRLLRLLVAGADLTLIEGLHLDGARALQPDPCDQQALIFAGGQGLPPGSVRALVRHVTLSNAGGDGVHVYSGAHVTVEAATILGCGRAGLSISGDGCTLDASRIWAPGDTLDHEPAPGQTANVNARGSVFGQIQTSGWTPETQIHLRGCLSYRGAALQVVGHLHAARCLFGGLAPAPDGMAGALHLRYPGVSLFEDCAFYGSVRVRWETATRPGGGPQVAIFRRCIFFGWGDSIDSNKYYGGGWVGCGLAHSDDRLVFEDCVWHGAGQVPHIGAYGGQVEVRGERVNGDQPVLVACKGATTSVNGVTVPDGGTAEVIDLPHNYTSQEP